MRVNMGREGRTSSSLSANGGTMLGSLILANGPSQPLEAATKYYVDTAFANLNANNVVDGVLPISSLPGFTGDATSNQGNNIITLANLGVNPGSYAKVIVDSKGRVTGNDVLSSSDLPVVNWSKIQNEPTTVEGYGITDALTTAGGTFTGNLSVGVPTQSLSAVNKQYVDSALSGNSAVVGDIIRKPYATTPVGFLRCNGGMVDKATYSDLYAVIGDNFNKYTVPGSGRPWQQQYEINTEHSGDIIGWSSPGNFPEIIHTAQFAVTKNRVYKFGGATTNNGYYSSVYYAVINADGSLGTWTATTNLPIVIIGATVIVVKNKLYLIGGSNAGGALNTVYFAEINSDGSLGTWKLASSLPVGTSSATGFLTKNRIYLIGGASTGTIGTANVYFAYVSDDGSIGNWILDTALPQAIFGSHLFVTKNRIYLCGGSNGTSIVSNVYTASINTNGSLGAWTTSTAMPTAVQNGQYFATKNRVYILGGTTVSNRTAVVYTAPINLDGTLGSWGTGTSLPLAISNSGSFVVKNKIYLVAGGTNADWIATIYSATIYGGKNDYSEYYSDQNVNYMMPGSGKPWEQQYQINTVDNFDPSVWLSDTSLPAALSRTSVVVTKNKVYLLGGTNVSGATSTVYVANINSDGSLGAWTTGSPLPTPVTTSSAIVTKNRVYLIGGQNATSPTNIVYTASIDSSGTIGVWGTGIPLPVTCTYCSAVVVSNYAYIFPGYVSGSASTAVYKAYIDTDGMIGEWSSVTSLPGLGGVSQIAVTKNKIYAVGRYALSTPSSAVYSTSVDSNGDLTSWVTEATSLPIAHGNAGIFVTGNKIYIFAGWTTGDVLTSAVEIGTLASDGSIIGWVTGTSLPVASNGKLFSTNSRLYYIGLHTSTAQSSVYYANFLGGLNDYSAYSDGTYSVAQIPNYLMAGSGKPWQQQYQINNTQTGDITGWSVGTSLPIQLGLSNVIVTKNRVYLLSGDTAAGNSYTSNVYTAPINSDGTLGTWTADTPLPNALVSSQAIVTRNRVYLLGGSISTGNSSTVYTAPINSDGTLGTWTTDTSLPIGISQSHAFIARNRVYLVAGSNTTNVYSAMINTNGTLGTWSIVSSFPISAQAGQSIVTKNRVYILATGTTNIYSATINSDGILGTWNVVGNLPAAMSFSQTIVTSSHAYLFGGYNAGTSLSTVYRAPIGKDGTLGTWVVGTSLPSDMYQSQAIMTKNRVYLLGGRNIASYLNTVFTASILEGLNDYSPYYDGTILPVSTGIDESTLFALPDFSNIEKNGVNIYIKY